MESEVTIESNITNTTTIIIITTTTITTAIVEMEKHGKQINKQITNGREWIWAYTKYKKKLHFKKLRKSSHPKTNEKKKTEEGRREKIKQQIITRTRNSFK